MRAAMLLALAGCNQIFGLNDPVGLVDAPVVEPADAPFPTVRLTHLVAQTHVTAPNTKGVPDPMLQRPALEDPAVKVGLLDGALVDAAYDASSGRVAIPPQLFDSAVPWRLQYRLGGVPHDVVWTTSREANEPKLVVPIVGRLPRTAPPVDSGYDIQPTGSSPPRPAVGNYRASRVFTTGVFMDIPTGASPNDTQIDGAAKTHVSGPLGTPDATAGDGGVLANYKVTGTCEHLVDGYAEFFVPPLSAGTRSTPLDGSLQAGQPAWVTSGVESIGVSLTNAGPFGLSVRLGDALDDRSDPSGALDPAIYQHGFAASELIPILTPERPISFLKTNVLALRRPPGPLMFLLAQCTLETALPGSFVVPVGLEPFPRITYGVATNRRSVGGIELLSSIVTADKAALASTFELDFGVPLPIDPITLSDGNAPAEVLSGPDDSVEISAATTFALDFVLEPDANMFTSEVDYLEVTLYQLNGGLMPLHVYVTANVARDLDGTLATPIQIDGADLVAGNEYVFQIRAVRGAPNAASGDFEAVAFPQAMATVFTRTVLVK